MRKKAHAVDEGVGLAHYLNIIPQSLRAVYIRHSGGIKIGNGDIYITECLACKKHLLGLLEVG